MMMLLLRWRKTLASLSEKQQQFFRTKTNEAFSRKPSLKELQQHLLEIGDDAVVLWNGSNDEEFVRVLLSLGTAAPGAGARVDIGDPSDCHENSARLQASCPERFAICTGYALSSDSVWRPHSWVWDTQRDEIIETTEKRVILRCYRSAGCYLILKTCRTRTSRSGQVSIRRSFCRRKADPSTRARSQDSFALLSG